MTWNATLGYHFSVPLNIVVSCYLPVSFVLHFSVLFLQRTFMVVSSGFLGVLTRSRSRSNNSLLSKKKFWGLEWTLLSDVDKDTSFKTSVFVSDRKWALLNQIFLVSLILLNERKPIKSFEIVWIVDNSR